ncbi:MAG TPA: L-aspartate oxidase [candidate division Zixibacteria bacterium]|nr:L-aspartate oxidase [candidate division Zixibacteria bacterium]
MERHYDFTVIGTGIAGLFYALQVVSIKPDAKIAIVTKKAAADSNTNRAQGGIAAVLSNTDSFEAHIKDTLEAGAGLCNPEIVRRVVEAGPAVIEELIRYGVNFSTEGGDLDLTREGGHSAKRVVHAGDLTGREIERALLNACRTFKSNIEIHRDSIALELLTYESGGQKLCAGALVLSEDENKITKFVSPVTMLSTGGLCQVYFHNTNPPIATGDGVAMSFRAGVTVSDLEFVQFHPTALYAPGKAPFLISEAVRGEGGRLRTTDGRFLMETAHPLKDLAPRDIVARAIDHELKISGADYVLLDISHKGSEFIKSRFPNIYTTCLRHGVDITTDPIPVVPAAHYACGGVKSDINGQTELPGLFVAGEVAMTGMHGANRLASNSLLEAVVVSKYAAKMTTDLFDELRLPESAHFEVELPLDTSIRGEFESKRARTKLTKLMSEKVGIVRSEKRLMQAQKEIIKLKSDIDEAVVSSLMDYELAEIRNLATVAELIAKSALWRKESRGLHFIEEYPKPSDEFKRDSEFKLMANRRRALA